MTEFVLRRRVVQKGRFWLHKCRRARADKGKMQISNEGARLYKFRHSFPKRKPLRGRVTTHSGTARGTEYPLDTVLTQANHHASRAFRFRCVQVLA